MRFLVFQHVAIEHPGILRDYMAADGVTWDAVELDEGEPIPDLEPYDALLVMGGPMDVWQEAEHPWLVPEKAAIRRWVTEMKRPYFGLCLGHQLLASALGAEVGPGKPEIGVLPVELTAEGRQDRLLQGVASPLQTLQWHSAEVKALPPGSVALASSGPCPINALRVGDKAWGLQFHVEVTPSTVQEWGAIPEYAQALEKSLGAGALSALEAKAAAAMPGFNAAAKQLYDNFASIVRRT